MKEVVVIPTFSRPEFLALALRSIDESYNPPDDIRIFADFGANLPEIEYVRDIYYPIAEIFHAKPHVKLPGGCWNILTSIKMGFETGADLVYLVEEDVMVRPHFFDWHREQHDGSLLASCGRKDARFYPLYPGAYTNPGSCLSKALGDVLSPHICEDYFRDLKGYLMRHFEPNDAWSTLDDGLIRRVIVKMGQTCQYPNFLGGVCAHQGIRGYRQFDIYKNEGGIKERIAELERLLASIRPGDRYALDFEV